MDKEIAQRAELCLEIIEIAATKAREGLSDKIIETEMIKTISNRFPQDSILGEETGYLSKRNNCLWIIDPIDGTKNYIDGLRLYGISIAVLLNGECVVGAVKIPSSNELFFRSKDKKDILIPFKNKKNPAERLILVSGKTDLTSKDFTVLLDYKDRYSPRILGSVTYSLMEFLKGNAKAVLLNNTEKWDILGSFFILQGLGAFIYAKNGERWTPKENNKKDFVISWDKNFIEFYLNLIKK